MAKRKKKWVPAGPEPGDLMVDVYDAKGENVVEQKCFSGGKGCDEFLSSLPKESLARVYRFSGWKLVQEQGHWYKD